MAKARPQRARPQRQDPRGLMCSKCNEHRAHGWWVGSEGIHAFTHGHKEAWCRCCMTKAQLEYAERAAAFIGELRARLEEGCVDADD